MLCVDQIALPSPSTRPFGTFTRHVAHRLANHHLNIPLARRATRRRGSNLATRIPTIANNCHDGVMAAPARFPDSAGLGGRLDVAPKAHARHSSCNMKHMTSGAPDRSFTLPNLNLRRHQAGAGEAGSAPVDGANFQLLSQGGDGLL
jgi:hypothetical protein